MVLKKITSTRTAAAYLQPGNQVPGRQCCELIHVPHSMEEASSSYRMMSFVLCRADGGCTDACVCTLMHKHTATHTQTCTQGHTTSSQTNTGTLKDVQEVSLQVRLALAASESSGCGCQFSNSSVEKKVLVSSPSLTHVSGDQWHSPQAHSHWHRMPLGLRTLKPEVLEARRTNSKEKHRFSGDAQVPC